VAWLDVGSRSPERTNAASKDRYFMLRELEKIF
jgi:hypothetical protein